MIFAKVPARIPIFRLRQIWDLRVSRTFDITTKRIRVIPKGIS